MSLWLVVGGAAATVGVFIFRKFGKGLLKKVAKGPNGSGPGGFLEGGFYGEMNKEEALQILGLKDRPTPEEVKQQHRKLMIKNHPDSGGSTYISTKINEAKDILLGNDKKKM